MNALFLTLTSLVALAIADADAVGRNAGSPCGDAQTDNASADNIKAANVTAARRAYRRCRASTRLTYRT